jgi:hypothetical protein
MLNWNDVIRNDVIRLMNHGNPEPPRRVEKPIRSGKHFLVQNHILSQGRKVLSDHTDLKCAPFLNRESINVCVVKPHRLIRRKNFTAAQAGHHLPNP